MNREKIEDQVRYLQSVSSGIDVDELVGTAEEGFLSEDLQSIQETLDSLRRELGLRVDR